jgi:hypothetical protein
MKLWRDEDGEEFSNSDVCFGKSFSASIGAVDVAKISIRGNYPATGWSYNEEAHEMAVITRGSGWIEVKNGERHTLNAGDVVHVAPMERFRWGGNMDMIVPCGPAFKPGKHHLEEE